MGLSNFSTMSDYYESLPGPPSSQWLWTILRLPKRILFYCVPPFVSVPRTLTNFPDTDCYLNVLSLTRSLNIYCNMGDLSGILAFKRIYLYEYEKWIRIKSHYTYICKKVNTYMCISLRLITLSLSGDLPGTIKTTVFTLYRVQTKW